MTFVTPRCMLYHALRHFYYFHDGQNLEPMDYSQKCTLQRGQVLIVRGKDFTFRAVQRCLIRNLLRKSAFCLLVVYLYQGSH